MKDETRLPTAILPGEALSRVRLILERPDDGHVLLVRYPALENDLRLGKTTDITSPRDYWSFKGLSVTFIGCESSVAEAVVRTAHRQLGIQVYDLEYLPLYNQHMTSSTLVRMYIWVREWSGRLPDFIENPDSISGYEGLHEWVAPYFLSFYLDHPEVMLAAQRWGECQKAKGAGA